MLNVRLSYHDSDLMWWENELQSVIEGKKHHAQDTQYGANLDNIEEAMAEMIKESTLPLKQLQDLSMYRPGEDCELTHKLSVVYTNENNDSDATAVVVMDAYKTYITVRVWAKSQALAKEYCDKIIMQVPLRDPPEPREDIIPMAFWQHDDQQGATCSIKDIQCPSITEIGANYPRGAQLNQGIGSTCQTR